MRKNDRFEQELNVAGAARRAKAFGIKTMTVVVTAAMLVSGVPTRVIAEGLQEAGVIAAQDSTDQGASSGGQQAADQSETQSQEPATDQSNTQEQSQATSEQAAQPSPQDNAAVAQNDSPSAQPAPFAQPSQQTATADIALTLNNASITYKGQVVAQPVQKVTAPTSDSFQFTVQPDNGYKLSKVALTVSGTDRELKADANGLYTVDAADVAQSPRVTLQTEQEKTAEPAKEATPIEDAEDVDSVDDETDDAAAVASEENVSVASDVSGGPNETIKAKVGDKVTLKGTKNKRGCGYSHQWEPATDTKNGETASVTFDRPGTYEFTHKYCKNKRFHLGIFAEHKCATETFTVVVSDNVVTSLTISGESSVKQFETIQLTTNAPDVTWSSNNDHVATVDQQGNVKGIAQGTVTITAQTLGTNGQLLTATKEITVTAAPETGVQDAYFFFLKPGMKPESNSAVDWYPENGAETDDNRGSINITDMKTDGSDAGNSRDNVENRVVSWPKNLGKQSADRLVLSRDNAYWMTLFNAYQEKTGITNPDDVKEIILRPYKISHPKTGYHLDCTVEVVAKSKVTAEFWVWNPGETGYTMIDTQTYTLDEDSVSVPVTTETLEEQKEYKGVTYKLYSWYDNQSISGAPVIFPATVSSNVKYYAKYVAQDQTVTVEYVDKATNNVLDSEIVTGLVKGQKVTKYPMTIRGYEVDEDSKNPKTAIAGTNSKIVFYYNAKKGEAGYNLSVPGATWSGDTSDLVPWDKDLKYKYNYGFAKDDTFNVTSAVPVADGKVFIGWLDKARDEQPSAIRYAGDQVTFIYSGSQTYCLDALWASLSATGEKVTYDGQPHGVTVDAAINDGSSLLDEYKQQAKEHVKLRGVEYKYGDTEWTTVAPTFVNAGEYPVSVRANVTIDGNETKRLTAETKVVISKRSVVLTSETASKPYDGTPLTKPDVTVSGDGFVEGEVSNIRAAGSVTTVAEGEVTNAIDFDKKDAFNPDNYVITMNEGKLSITELSAEDGLTINPNSVDYLYNATKHAAGAATAKASASDTKVNLEYRVKGTGENSWVTDPAAITATDAGVTTIEVRASAANYSGYKYAEQTLTINKRTVELKSAGATKVYDGTPLVNDQVTVLGDGFIESDLAEDVHATGTQTEAGTSNNTISYKLKEGVAKNYNILPEKLGMLTVTAQSIDPKNPDGYKGVTISSPSNSVYDGNEHKWAPEVKDAGGNALKEGADYTVAYDKDDFTNVTGEINVTITGKGNYAGTIAKSYRITKAPLHVVTGSATKVYDGKALTSETVTIDGLAKRDRIGIAVTGSQTNVGSSQNTYTIDWMQTSADNYELTDELGTLTVTAAPARPSSPTTSVTPTTPTVPNPTPNSSDGGSTTTTAAPTGEDSATGNDQEQKEEKIIDAKNPLGKFDGKKDTCWVHWYMIICAVATAAYGLFVGLRRDKHSRRLQNDLDKVLGNDDETRE